MLEDDGQVQLASVSVDDGTLSRLVTGTGPGGSDRRGAGWQCRRRR